MRLKVEGVLEECFRILAKGFALLVVDVDESLLLVKCLDENVSEAEHLDAVAGDLEHRWDVGPDVLGLQARVVLVLITLV